MLHTKGSDVKKVEKVLDALRNFVAHDVVSTWMKAYRCMECQEVLSTWEYAHNAGICPMCGHFRPGTFVYCEGGIMRVHYRKYLGLIRIEQRQEFVWSGREA